VIQRYFEQIRTCVDAYSAADLVVSASVNCEVRPGLQGYLSGAVIFADGSILHFAEFLDEAHGQVEKLMYTYHYQDANHQLLFRYDNARHRPALPMREHKHTPDGVINAPAPLLAEVLAEIMSYQETLLFR